jgi:hypothetical protein
MGPASSRTGQLAASAENTRELKRTEARERGAGHWAHASVAHFLVLGDIRNIAQPNMRTSAASSLAPGRNAQPHPHTLTSSAAIYFRSSVNLRLPLSVLNILQKKKKKKTISITRIHLRFLFTESLSRHLAYLTC